MKVINETLFKPRVTLSIPLSIDVGIADITWRQMKQSTI